MNDPSRNWPKAVGLGKGTTFQSEPIPEGSDAELLRRGATQTRSYPE